MAEVIAGSPLVGPREREDLLRLIEEIGRGDLLDAEERYVDLFDRGRALSLHLFEHLHGDGRDRGTAMVELKRLYAAAGFELTARELPDYLPVVLEYLSVRDRALKALGLSFILPAGIAHGEGQTGEIGPLRDQKLDEAILLFLVEMIDRRDLMGDLFLNELDDIHFIVFGFDQDGRRLVQQDLGHLGQVIVEHGSKDFRRLGRHGHEIFQECFRIDRELVVARRRDDDA